MYATLNNYGLGGQIVPGYDNFFFSKKKREERKAKREEKQEKKEDKKEERAENRDERKDKRNKKKDLKNQMKEAEIEEKKVQSAALLAMTQNANKDEDEPPTEASGTEKIIVYVILGLMVVGTAGYLMLRNGKNAALLKTNQPVMNIPMS